MLFVDKRVDNLVMLRSLVGYSVMGMRAYMKGRVPRV